MNKENYEYNRMGYVLYNLVALISILMITDIFAVCGTGDTYIMVYQMIKYVPQGVFMMAAPILCYVTYHEIIPRRWKIIKLFVIGALFTISMIIAMKFGIPLLEVEYGNAQTKLMVFPMTFYLNMTVGILDQFGILKWEGKILRE